MAGVLSEFEYHPMGIAAFKQTNPALGPGVRMRLARSLPEGAKRAGLGRRHVENAETGEYIGAIPRAHMQRVTKKRPTASETPDDDARMQGIWSDRREGSTDYFSP